ncbi:MAG TPA: oligosaccharide flippase family protein, partial [Pseudomonadales bacterium]|nr:oligosaccharide flippase family protein [Pseudomonadales bacterium]
MTEEKSQGLPPLRQSVIALTVLQGVNNFIPLLVLPFLARVLGVSAYGEVAFAQALMANFILVTNYSFTWSTTRKVAVHRSDGDYVNQLFISAWCSQWLLLALSAAAAFAIYLFNPFPFGATAYVAAFTAVVGNVLFPAWFLQGLEYFRAMTIIQVTSRLLGLAALLMLVRGPDDVALVLAIQGGAMMVAGVVAIGWLRYKGIIRFARPAPGALIGELKEGFTLFGSRLAMNMYTTFVPLIVGWVAGSVAVACFTVATKVRQAGHSLLEPLARALFPRMSHLFVHEPRAAR